MTRPDQEIVIVGGGIVGAACAEACARMGRDVLLLESGRIATGATGAAMGHICALPESDADLTLSLFSRRLWESRAPELSAEVAFSRSGTIWVASEPSQLDSMRIFQRRLQGQNCECSWLTAAQLRFAEPALDPSLEGGLLVPGDRVVRPAAATKWLLDQARDHGSTVREESPVSSVCPRSVTLRDGSEITANHVVVAAGLSSSGLVADLPLAPRKGHLIQFDAPTDLIHHQIAEVGYGASVHSKAAISVAFNAQPAPGGGLILGASRQRGATDEAVESSVLRALRERASRFLPSIGDLRGGRSRAGLRPASEDGRPFIGPAPGPPGLWLATGHEGLGITESMGTGALIAELIAGRSPSIDLTHYWPAPSRFRRLDPLGPDAARVPAANTGAGSR